jgi:hypothetical protein
MDRRGDRTGLAVGLPSGVDGKRLEAHGGELIARRARNL